MPDLSISDDFLPPDLSENAKEKVFERMFAQGEDDDPVFDLNVTLFGKVAMVVCWYYDGNMDGYEDFVLAARLVRRVPALLAGRFEKLTEDELFCFHDALASFPRRDEDLEAVAKVVERRWQARNKDLEDRAEPT